VALDALVRAGVALATALTAPLQASVGHEAWLSQDALGAPVYATRVDVPALVEHKSRLVRAADGREVMAATKVTVLQPITIAPVDRLTLPDGTTPPILTVEGLVDPAAAVAGQPYLASIWCGA